MSNVTLTARTTASDVLEAGGTAASDIFGMVSETTSTASTVIKSLGNYADVMEAHSRDYKETYIRTAAATRDDRIAENIENLAYEHGKRAMKRQTEMANNPELAKHVEEAKQRFLKADKAAVAKLNSK